MNRLFKAAAVATLLLALGGSAFASPKSLELVDKLAARAPAAAPSEKARTAYLLVYFKDETHAVYFATSADGFTFTDVNGGEPIFTGAQLAEQKGVRDPHIMRGPDGAFYMAMTDLHIFAKEAGLRDTQWERPQAEYGWGNNKNLILMKSFDLIHWTHARVAVDDLFDEVKDLGAAWAPETIWDPAAKALMVYFTTRTGTGPDHLVYSYANAAFTTLTSAPKPLFTYPVAGKSAIDGDITKIGGKYHLFYVAHDKPGYLRQAISDQINAGWVFDPAKVDPETVGTEAPNLWRRHGSDTYVLMYDVFGAKPKNNMGFSETTDFIRFKNIGRFNEPGSPMKTTNFANPKHGAVIAITPAEAQRLKDYFAAR
ncbi:MULTISPECIES: glycoside hydrolase family 43 protein [unclassified Caulobacter]|uniref:glycoside hydrolase family 43 protein n=1 Tax=unclassified Caulobacter TaxID=2648921 RepID=UPI0006F9C860|nr:MULTISPECIES: glycoside hydrolase family 43 protein [unclassified Caulobacter]KQV56334.1 beta-xylosidase [Caulobacter sp. Root342]KQV71234.1 beta-xylosidase [Caulobacter sp. Root343]